MIPASADRIALRAATTADARDIADLFLRSRRAALPYLPELHTDDETRSYIADRVLRHCTVLVALLKGRLAGFVALRADMVEHLYVRPEDQGRGVGDRLLAEAKALAPGRLRLFTFQRNGRARAFYEARGFRAIAFGDGSGNEENEPDVLYEWSPERDPHPSRQKT